jgi:flap endonuclease-1
LTHEFLQLSKRFERREEAKEEGEEAKETGTVEDVDRFSRRTVKVTKEHNEECRRLLGLMGIPFVVVCSILVVPPNREEKLNPCIL